MMYKKLTNEKRRRLHRRTFHTQELPQANRRWHSRGYLPHADFPQLVQLLTFRLADALPEEVLRRIELESQLVGCVDRGVLEEPHLNAGHGSCCLGRPSITRLVERAFFYFDGIRYCLAAWVVMPNHCHVLLEQPRSQLSTILHSWKSFTASQANKFLGRFGRLWQKEYHDRYIRNAEHFSQALEYIHYNPVKAGLTDSPEKWPFSSAALARRDWLQPRWERLSKEFAV